MAEEKDVYRWKGEKVEVSWDKRLCIHVQECTRAKGEIFQSGREPWALPDNVGPDQVAEIVGRCPTGSLAYVRSDGGAEETAADENTVVVANNGPLYVRGDLEVDGVTDDMPGGRFRVALCRCGQSSKKPFCDNTHEKVGFTDRGAIGESGPGIDAPGGKLRVGRAQDGPLLVSGNFTMISGAGCRTWTGAKAALCRCGASKKKPFCDGSHKEAGFEAD